MTDRCWLSEDGLTLVTLRPGGEFWDVHRRSQGMSDGAWIYSGVSPNHGQPARSIVERWVVEKAPGPVHAGIDDSWLVVDSSQKHRPRVASFSAEWVDAEDWAEDFARGLNEAERKIAPQWKSGPTGPVGVGGPT